ncbi:hypothetical protein D5086_011488 [Populus alba]|uniref:Uncharacterized protein n=1 Tax=Populus alba TaxID=43335 RepID=A0ACC4CDU5_POPAL
MESSPYSILGAIASITSCRAGFRFTQARLGPSPTPTQDLYPFLNFRLSSLVWYSVRDDFDLDLDYRIIRLGTALLSSGLDKDARITGTWSDPGLSCLTPLWSIPLLIPSYPLYP